MLPSSMRRLCGVLSTALEAGPGFFSRGSVVFRNAPTHWKDTCGSVPCHWWGFEARCNERNERLGLTVVVFEREREPYFKLTWDHDCTEPILRYEGPLAQAPAAERAMLVWALAATDAVQALPPKFQAAVFASDA